MRDSGDHLPAPRRDGVAGAVAAPANGPPGDPTSDPPILYTIGHSIRPAEDLIDLLKDAGVRRLVDVRTVPRSRRNPQFEAGALARSLAMHQIDYRHEPALGGFRRPRPDSRNGGWEVAAFRGYADYMGSPEFGAALDRLMAMAMELPTAIVCAEAQWWRCHRRLISDALVVRGWRVEHLGLGAEPVEHELTPFALVGPNQALSYPPAQGELEPA